MRGDRFNLFLYARLDAVEGLCLVRGASYIGDDVGKDGLGVIQPVPYEGFGFQAVLQVKPEIGFLTALYVLITLLARIGIEGRQFKAGWLCLHKILPMRRLQ